MRRWVLAFQRFRTGLIIDINTDAVTAIIIAIKPIVEAGPDIMRVDSDQVTILEIQIDITTGSMIITKTIITIITVTIITIRTDIHLSMLTTVKPTPIARIEQLIIMLNR